MIVLSNRDVYLFGIATDDGVNVVASWLKDKAIAGTEQQLWDREAGIVHGVVTIPKTTDQVHTDTFFPYVTALETAA
ncbi:MAG: hypothetical protein AAFV85_23080 [Cyanobacteria bacterium J06634_6]